MRIRLRGEEGDALTGYSRVCKQRPTLLVAETGIIYVLYIEVKLTTDLNCGCSSRKHLIMLAIFYYETKQYRCLDEERAVVAPCNALLVFPRA